MKGRGENTGLIAGVVLLVCGVAMSQVAPVQTGRRLDRNPQVGSGGYNAPTGGSGGVNSQLYVSGLVTGGVGQVQTGRALDSSLQIGSGGYNVVGGGIGGVNRQLFMNRQVRGRGLFRGDPPYYELRAAPSAIRVPGTVIGDSRKVIDSVLAKSLYADATAGYASVARVTPGRGILAIESLGPLDTRKDLTPRASARRTLSERPGASAPLGILRQEDWQQLADQLQQLPTDNRINAKIGPETRPPAHTKVDGGDLVTVEPGPLGVVQTRPPRLPKQGQDVFMDILVGLQIVRKAKTAGGEWTTIKPRLVTTTAPVAGTVVEKPKVTVRRLAGMGRNEFNLWLAEGQKLLKEGKYYSAADRFELAAIAKPTNPLARVGGGLAMLAAGEPLSAARRFRAAIEVFPPVMETRFNFAEMIDREHLMNRKKEVNHIVNSTPKPHVMMAFLSTYLSFNARLPMDTKFYARKLTEAVTEDKILAAYARFALTGKRPDQAKEKASKENQK